MAAGSPRRINANPDLAAAFPARESGLRRFVPTGTRLDSKL